MPNDKHNFIDKNINNLKFQIKITVYSYLFSRQTFGHNTRLNLNEHISAFSHK